MNSHCQKVISPSHISNLSPENTQIKFNRLEGYKEIQLDVLHQLEVEVLHDVGQDHSKLHDGQVLPDATSLADAEGHEHLLQLGHLPFVTQTQHTQSVTVHTKQATQQSHYPIPRLLELSDVAYLWGRLFPALRNELIGLVNPTFTEHFCNAY